MNTIASLIAKLFNVYQFLIVVWCILSWVPRTGGQSNLGTFRDAVGMLVEPYLGIFRRIIPPMGGIDFSPIVAIFALGIIEKLLFGIIL